MNNHANNTFDELIEAMWAGDLNEAGLARLEALAAADPALARRLRHERDLSALMAGHGPNRAPAGLAQAVFARLDLDAQPAAQPARARIVPRSIWFTPAFRWGLAAAALAVVFIHVKWLLNRDRLGGDTIAQVRTVPLKTPSAMPSQNGLARFATPKPGQIKTVTTTGATSIAVAVSTPKPAPTVAATPKPAPSPTPESESTIVLHMVIPTDSVEAATPARGLSAKQIMRAITEAGGSVKGIQPVRSNPQVWRVEGSIPPSATTALVERLGQLGIKPARAAAVLPYQFGVMQGAGLLRRAETTTATRHASMPAQHSAPIPLTVMIEETPLKK